MNLLPHLQELPKQVNRCQFSKGTDLNSNTDQRKLILELDKHCAFPLQQYVAVSFQQVEPLSAGSTSIQVEPLSADFSSIVLT